MDLGVLSLFIRDFKEGAIGGKDAAATIFVLTGMYDCTVKDQASEALL